MNSEVNPKEAIKRLDEYLKKVEVLLKKKHGNGSEKKARLITSIKGFIQTVFKDDDKKIKDFEKAKPFMAFIGGVQTTEDEWQDYYISHLKKIKNHLLAFKEELTLIIDSKKDSEVIDKLEEETNIIKAESGRRSAVAEEKRWGAMIELIQMQREELKKRGLLSQEIIEIKKDIAEIKNILMDFKKQVVG